MNSRACRPALFEIRANIFCPARFDDTEISGLLPTIAYIDLTNYDPEEFANLIVQKVKDPTLMSGDQHSNIDAQLEARLADAVIWAEDYLKLQILDLSDQIAEAVRSSFREVNLEPTRLHLLPYIRNQKAAYRVVAYLAVQISHPKDMILDLVAALDSERIEAGERKETRPLWQLLVCFTYELQYRPVKRELIKTALANFLEFYENRSCY
jgi:hypothetical protein